MGLIKSALNSAGGVMGDQWREYFYCDSIPSDVLMLKGVKRTDGRSSNRGDDNIISNGSVINIADGQCMMIVESGKVVDLCAEPGEYIYDMSSEPSLFYGNLADNIGAVFAEIGKRFTFGGQPAKDQRVYYFNTKEIMGNKYGTASPVPFRVVDRRAGIDIDISVKCFGEYSFRLTNPLLFYQNVAGNVENEFRRQQFEGQLRTEFLTKLQPAFAQLSAMGIRYSALPGHTRELSEAMKNLLSGSWGGRLGIEIVAVGMSSIKADEEDEQMIKDMQRTAAYTDPNLAMAYTVTSRGQAMRDAANNSAGAATGFMGMGMLGGLGGNDNTMQTLYQMQQAQPKQQAAPAQDGWKCSCGAVNNGKFCSECGSPKPVQDTWTCSCGTVNKGKFCSECGSKKPEAARQYKCSTCGWQPEPGAQPPKFCPECGNVFDDNDLA